MLYIDGTVRFSAKIMTQTLKIDKAEQCGHSVMMPFGCRRRKKSFGTIPTEPIPMISRSKVAVFTFNGAELKQRCGMLMLG